MIAYICEQGANVTRKGQRLLVATRAGTQTLLADELEQVVIFGNVQLTTQALALLFTRDIDTVYLNMRGEYRGRLVASDGANGALRKKQFLLHDDNDFRLKTAKKIVEAKLHNQAYLLERIGHAHKRHDVAEAGKELRHLAETTGKIASLESLRGHEGGGAAHYFQYLPLAFNKDWGFVKRTRRPPTDPVNVVLSFLYTLLANRCHAACHLAGLDPCPGNLHELAYGRNSLPLDLMEEFRAVIVDPLVISIFNLHIVKKNDFIPIDSPPSGNDEDETGLTTQQAEPQSGASPGTAGLRLEPEALKKVIAAFAKKMESEFAHPGVKKKMTYHEAVRYQAHIYHHVIDGTAQEYIPLLFR